NPPPQVTNDAQRNLDAGGDVTALAFCPTDGKVLAWGTADGHVKLADTSGNTRFSHKGASAVTAIAFVEKGKTWYVAYEDGALEIRDAQTGALKATQTAKEMGGVTRMLAVSPDGYYWAAAVVSQDGKKGRVKFWKA